MISMWLGGRKLIAGS